MPSFGPVVPILRIFDEAKAREFYVGFLGCKIVFEHRFGDNFPLYMGVSLAGCELHLSEHYGDGGPGAHVRIGADDIDGFTKSLREKDYKFVKPGDAERQPWGALEVTIADPFGNRLTFTQEAGDADSQAPMPGVTFPEA